MDRISKEQRSRNMAAIKSSGTKDEIALAKALWILGYRYRKNNKTVFGKPDITFKKLKIAIFIDSEFFHGKDWSSAKHKIKSNQAFWHNKIERNIERDNEVTTFLLNSGWIVLRFWSTEVRKDISKVIELIIKNIQERKFYILQKNN